MKTESAAAAGDASAVETKELALHPAANIFPLLEGPDFDAMVADIKTNGLREPITLFAGEILDGRNRYRACLASGVEPKVREFPGNGSPLEYVLSLNLHRRHLDESQRAMVAGKIATLKDGQRKAATSIDVPSQPEAAKMLNVGVASVQRARKVLNSGNKELISKVEQGEIAVSKAAATIAPPKLKVVHDPAPVPTTNVTTTITPDTSITTRDTTKKFRMLRVYLATQVGAIPEEQRGEFASELEKIATEIRENGRVS